jgi:predicted dehydrogenase/threonine dehydrogenase-like Zn-dependent dehydrogenase
MKQVLQSLKNGEVWLEDVPQPLIRSNHVLIRTSRSIVSAGTEKMLIDFGKANLLNKARQQPDKVREVVDKIKTDGLLPTIEAVQGKLDQAIPLGYCNVGTVIGVGEGVTQFSVGDRVVSNGPHAEVVCVPQNLCAHVPDNVSDESAAFTVLGAIALQGIRLLKTTLGETVAVIGLGLIGLISVQLLRASGCRVIGIDFPGRRLDLARQFGAEVIELGRDDVDPVATAIGMTDGVGVDAVVIAAATKSNDPVHQAAQMCRKRGRVVLVGVVGLQLQRADFYEKELTFQVSCSYGPGRYDPQYEQKGNDYPLPFVRWTAQRNFDALLSIMSSGQIDLDPLLSHRFQIDSAMEAYATLEAGGSLGILLRYRNDAAVAGEIGTAETRPHVVYLPQAKTVERDRQLSVGFIGAGGYANKVLFPAFSKASASCTAIASLGGVSAARAAKKFGSSMATTDLREILENPRIDAVVIATRHDSHASLVETALTEGKYVFVEKPLVTTAEQLTRLEDLFRREPQLGNRLMVGFNRRFSPLIGRCKEQLRTLQEPKIILMTINAGAIPREHWSQDDQAGGGRIIGEACHFIDLATYLVGSPVTGMQVTSMAGLPVTDRRDDKVSFTLQYADGSLCTIVYAANGHKSFPKERVEIFAGNRVLQIDNFRSVRGFGWPRRVNSSLWRQDKGNNACVAQFVDSARNRQPCPIPLEELMEVSKVTLDVASRARS